MMPYSRARSIRTYSIRRVHLASAQGYSFTNKVLQTCNGWLMEGKRGDGSPAVLFADPKMQTIVDTDFR